jgi:cobyrinic acid a,c-diamide synthase
MALVIAGERSGVGKTTVTLGILAYLRRQGLQVQSFKVGPDYIDPMFHRYVTGLPCRNLDPMLTSEPYVQQCFAQYTQTVDCALVEGVMGLYDGAAPESCTLKFNLQRWADLPNQNPQDFASTAHVARLLDLPVLFVVDCSRLSNSVAALVQGYKSFYNSPKFAGVVLNRVGSDRHLALLNSALDSIQIPVLGTIRRDHALQIPDRHLGLIPTAELPNLDRLIAEFGDRAKTWFNWSILQNFLNAHPLLSPAPLASPAQDAVDQVSPQPLSPSAPQPRIVIAQDSAFSFYYADNLELLEKLGAELVPWSPLRDRTLPKNVHGLYFGGGFPEVFAAQLSANETARASVKAAILAGMPTYAECGGLMYLCEQIVDFAGQSFPMVGIVPTAAVMDDKLTLGYRGAIAQYTTPLARKGQPILGHEFHRSRLKAWTDLRQEAEGRRQEAGGKKDFCEDAIINCPDNVHASYIHLHWGAVPELPHRFIDECKLYAKTNAF